MDGWSGEARGRDERERGGGRSDKHRRGRRKRKHGEGGQERVGSMGADVRMESQPVRLCVCVVVGGWVGGWGRHECMHAPCACLPLCAGECAARPCKPTPARLVFAPVRWCWRQLLHASHAGGRVHVRMRTYEYECLPVCLPACLRARVHV
eukprot:199900-Chlamydomonas_euryale.AAC.4